MDPRGPFQGRVPRPTSPCPAPRPTMTLQSHLAGPARPRPTRRCLRATPLNDASPDPAGWTDIALVRVSGPACRIIRICERSDASGWHYRAVRGWRPARGPRIGAWSHAAAFRMLPTPVASRLDTDALLDAMHAAEIVDGGPAGPGEDLILHWVRYEIARAPERRMTRAGEIEIARAVRVSSRVHRDLGHLAAGHIERFICEWMPGQTAAA